MGKLEENIAKLDGYLARFKDAGILNRIAGQDLAGSQGTFQSTSPVDKSVICEVAHGAAEDIDAAAKAAHAAFADWRDMPALERKKILIKVA
jgi:5-carboxymethyl-2-hydroxymuconic-semialdehyde dehydrogenase